MPEINQITTEIFGITLSNPDEPIVISLGTPGIQGIKGDKGDPGEVTADSVNDAAIGNRTVDQETAVAFGNTGLLTQFLSWFAKQLKVITGKPNWYDPPAITLESAATQISSNTATLATKADQSSLELHTGNLSNPHATTAAQVGADSLGTAAGLLAAHVAEVDPHSQYINSTELTAALATKASTGANTDITSLASGLQIGNGSAGSKSIVFNNGFSGSLQSNPTSARVWTLPDSSGVLATKIATTTQNALVRFGNTTGDLVNNTNTTLSDAGVLSVVQLNSSRLPTSAANSAHLFTYSDTNTNVGRNVLALGINNRAGNWAGLSAAVDGASDSINLPVIRFYGVDRALAIWNSSAEVLRVISTNLLGIGTTTPGAKLQVTGGLAVSNATTAATDPGSGNLSVTGTIKVASGTALARLITATATLDFPSIAAQSPSDLTVTVTGATAGDSVALGLPSVPTAGIVFNAFVSAANTVTVRATNVTGAAIDPASASYRVTVIGF